MGKELGVRLVTEAPFFEKQLSRNGPPGNRVTKRKVDEGCCSFSHPVLLEEEQGLQKPQHVNITLKVLK